MKQITMKTIAEHAGVSLMTVSRALRNNPRLPVATRTRIQKIATDLGYRPNPLVSALMTQLRSTREHKVSPTLAFLAAHPDAVYSSGHTYNAQIHAGACERAAQLGYKLQRFSLCEPGMTWHRMRGMLHARGISGVILPPLPDPIPDIDFDWEHFACATIGYSYTTPALHRVANDQFHTIRTAINHLVTLGYQRIGLAIRHEDDRRVDNKWAGGFLSFHPYLPAKSRLPIFLWHYEPATPPQRPPDGFESWEGRVERPHAFATWLERHQPDAILALQPLILRDWLSSLGKRVPKDIALVSLNLQPNQPSFSGIDQNNHLVGAAAVELVVEQIHHNDHGVPARAKTVMISGDWVEGSTTKTLSPSTPARHPPESTRARPKP